MSVLPWMKLYREVFEHARNLSVLLDVDEDRALALLVKTWDFLVTSGPRDAPPDGVVRGPKAAALIERRVGWGRTPTDRPGAFIEAMTSSHMDLLEELPDGEGLRIRGADLYESAWKKNYEAKPDKPKARGRGRPETGGEPSGDRGGTAGEPPGDRKETPPQTQTQTQTHVETTPPRVGTCAREETATPSPLPRAYESDLVEAVCELFRKHRDGADYGLEESGSLRPEEAKALRRCLEYARWDEHEVLRRLENGLLNRRFEIPDLVQLAKHWDWCARPPPEPAPPRGRREALDIAAIDHGPVDDAESIARKFGVKP